MPFRVVMNVLPAARLGGCGLSLLPEQVHHREGQCLCGLSDSGFSLSPAKAVNEATCTWSGQLPPRNYKNPIYSCKVFLGGVPWDITEGEL